MIKDFRAISFESIFNSDINFGHTEVVKNKLEDNQLLRCNQLLENTKLTKKTEKFFKKSPIFRDFVHQ